MKTGYKLAQLLLLSVILGTWVAADEASIEALEGSNLRLIGIAVFQGKPTALIENHAEGIQRFYEQGDALDSYVVKKIEAKRVILSREGSDSCLPLFDTPEIKAENEVKQDENSAEGIETKLAKRLKSIVKDQENPKFLIPVKGEVKSGYGYRQHPMGGGRQFHRGVDIAAPYGTPVRAVADGVVSFASRKWGMGNTVSIKHDKKWSSVNGHLSSIKVKKGEEVKAGQTIGRIGSTGISTGPHLHFELHKYGRAVNPANYLPLGK